MWSKVCGYIKENNLLNTNDLYIVALSGGADSVALLLLLKEHGFNVHAAHCNFCLRGAESDRDEAFCVELCRRIGVELHRVHFDTREYALLHKVSIEMAARELRYGWFAQLCKDLGAAGICVAHHRDDSVETVLLNLVRGTGLRGLTGIKPQSQQVFACGKNVQNPMKLTVLRPLLCVSRAEIERFLVERGQKYVTDSSNLEADVLRNKIRLQVLPLLRELNPAASENIVRTAENLGDAQAVLDEMLDDIKDCNSLDISDCNDLRCRKYFVYEWLKKYGFNGKQMKQILASETGAVFTSPMGYEVYKDRSRLVLGLSSTPFRAILVPEEGTYVLGGEPCENKIRVRKCDVYVSKNSSIATLDAAKVRFPLTIRRVEEGDRMQPYGMKGTKLLSDMMTDLKMNLFEKRSQLVVVDRQGVIVWLVGIRIDARVAVSESTTYVLELQIGQDRGR